MNKEDIEKLKYIKRKIKKIDRAIVDYHCCKHVRVRKRIAELLDYLAEIKYERLR